jgi:outer membrane lipoprotein SlyB
LVSGRAGVQIVRGCARGAQALRVPVSGSSSTIGAARAREMQFHLGMKAKAMIASFLVLALGCATTATTSSTWVDPAAGGHWVRPGRVESVQEIVERVEGNPAGGAIAGALIGGFLFGGRGPGRLIAAAGGAAIGAAASQGSAETRTYQVLVRFDDGSYGMFVYRGYSPFRPGEAVVLTPHGLARS